MMTSKTKAIMQIQLDQNDIGKIGQDLLEYAVTLSNALGMNTEEIVNEMSKGDLNHLIQTFNNYFGEYIELLDPNQAYLKS